MLVGLLFCVFIFVIAQRYLWNTNERINQNLVTIFLTSRRGWLTEQSTAPIDHRLVHSAH